ncbi:MULTISPECIES: nucleoside-diphosphate sugar epimerase/dehydratase [unclassified Bacillus (in: firmicutes)]|uniref:polysaccharide biosynthesis protein n=1 Tax=unclassified Bacillus (in: firmicutes) TaxID=185979 RepID=UPI001BE9A90E|nr:MULTISPECIES: nucleoside-diphosphate sugar epimerase/dehydratase [unclassified Bacillus (in: firmicutes)]MBT2616769.1 polysaccharide biosynthesis protein [Bacillus sp. ISL-78]MBT2631487.1 polysaccharide biosynthesis protein [Bacillus sp. ISL-101]
MSYKRRVPIFVLLDSIIVLFAIFIGYFILYPYLNIYTTIPMLLVCSITLLLSHHLFATIYRLYQKAWKYASVGELLTIFKVVTFSILMTAIVQLIINHDIYFRVLGITWMLHIILIGGSRFSLRVYRDSFISLSPNKKRTLIVGAGSAGTMVVRQLLKNSEADLYPVAFVDDDPNKYKLQIYGIPVIGEVNNISDFVQKHEIDTIIIAIPSLNKIEINRIFDECAKTEAKTQIMPMLEDLMTGKVSVNQIRDVQVEDLLGREPIELDIKGISKELTDRTILVTGAGGSIGSEICRQICMFKPAKILLLGHGEFSIYNIEMELTNKYQSEIEIVPIIADVQDRARIFDIVDEYKPDVIYHAAAHKHVPLMEYNPMEAVKNNILGTKNVAEAADAFSVNSFVLVSTDKAVNPPNVMGSTKRFAEMIIQNLAKESKTKFVAVRFGNVLGSRGSVIPLFKNQILAGGPVTVTHPDMTRYFMTIPEASRLVIQAGTLARGGEVFVLDMGDPVKIVDLAKNLIILSGYTEEEVGIEFSGIRPGEKLYEELLNENEVQEGQIFPKIHIGKAEPMDKNELYSLIETLTQKGTKELKDILITTANTKFSKRIPVANR